MGNYTGMTERQLLAQQNNSNGTNEIYREDSLVSTPPKKKRKTPVRKMPPKRTTTKKAPAKKAVAKKTRPRRKPISEEAKICEDAFTDQMAKSLDPSKPGKKTGLGAMSLAERELEWQALRTQLKHERRRERRAKRAAAIALTSQPQTAAQDATHGHAIDRDALNGYNHNQEASSSHEITQESSNAHAIDHESINGTRNVHEATNGTSTIPETPNAIVHSIDPSLPSPGFTNGEPSTLNDADHQPTTKDADMAHLSDMHSTHATESPTFPFEHFTIAKLEERLWEHLVAEHKGIHEGMATWRGQLIELGRLIDERDKTIEELQAENEELKKKGGRRVRWADELGEDEEEDEDEEMTDAEADSQGDESEI